MSSKTRPNRKAQFVTEVCKELLVPRGLVCTHNCTTFSGGRKARLFVMHKLRLRHLYSLFKPSKEGDLAFLQLFRVFPAAAQHVPTAGVFSKLNDIGKKTDGAKVIASLRIVAI